MVGRSKAKTLKTKSNSEFRTSFEQNEEMSSLLTFVQTLFRKLNEKLVSQSDRDECPIFCGRQVFAMRKRLLKTQIIFFFDYNRSEWQKSHLLYKKTCFSTVSIDWTLRNFSLKNQLKILTWLLRKERLLQNIFLLTFFKCLLSLWKRLISPKT